MQSDPKPHPALRDLSSLELDPREFSFRFSARARGVQIYPWNSETETFGKPHPEAVLVTSNGELIRHSAGPKWTAADNSFVTGSLLSSASPHPTAIPWVLLSAVSGGTTNGILSGIERILRLHTKEGMAPASNSKGLAEIPVLYEAEYYFYAAADFR